LQSRDVASLVEFILQWRLGCEHAGSLVAAQSRQRFSSESFPKGRAAGKRWTRPFGVYIRRQQLLSIGSPQALSSPRSERTSGELRRTGTIASDCPRRAGSTNSRLDRLAATTGWPVGNAAATIACKRLGGGPRLASQQSAKRMMPNNLPTPNHELLSKSGMSSLASWSSNKRPKQQPYGVNRQPKTSTVWCSTGAAQVHLALLSPMQSGYSCQDSKTEINNLCVL
jgi:hypothetical protein